MMKSLVSPPLASQIGSRQALMALRALRHGFDNMLPVLEMVHRQLGDVFQIPLGNFRPVVVASPRGLRQALVERRETFRWRPKDDPVTRLLRRGILVTDGELHDCLRAVMATSNTRRHFALRSQDLWREVDRLTANWQSGQRYDMFVEMRKLALAIFERVYFSYDLWPELPRLWDAVMAALQYISPGMWIFLGASDPPKSVRRLDEHFYALIRQRRADPQPPDDLLTHLVQALEDDELVRDQLITMFIAGHDTSTAALAWTLYLMGRHPYWLTRACDEVRQILGRTPPTPDTVDNLDVLDQIVKESLRLYPPIHIGNRFSVQDVELDGYQIPAGTRVMLSYYLVQRHPDWWEAPDEFRPHRWEGDLRPHPFTYLPFGGGPRNCIGGPFAQLEMRLVLARLLQRFDFVLRRQDVRAQMHAALEPHPGVEMEVHRLP